MQVSRIQIYPGDVPISVGQKATFSAVAYDSEDNAISGIRFTWRGYDVERSRPAPVSPRGDFKARIAGTFTVTAEASGQQSQVAVTVLEGERRGNSDQVTTREVSTRDVPQEVSSLPKKERGEMFTSHARLSRSSKMARAPLTRAAAAAAPAAALFVDSYWDDSNYTSADDPGNQVGDTPGAPADGGAGNGNFQLAAPILGLAGRGIDISLGLAYNSRLWNKAGSEISYDIDRSWPAPGWNLGFGKILGMGVYNGGMLVDADGTRRSYNGTVTIGPNNAYTDFVGHTTDGTFIDYKYHTGLGGALTYAEAKYPNGTIIEYGVQGTQGMYPTRITDANGNYITVTYRNNTGPEIQTITDTLGRVITFYYDSNNLLTAITAPGLTSGTTRTLVRLHYKTLTLNYGFSGLTARTRTTTPYVLDAIYYPSTGTGYWFGDTDSYSSYGMIAKVEEQRGMVFSAASLTVQGTVTQGTVSRTSTYSYPLTPNSTLTDAPTYAKRTDTWDGMDTAAAVTNFMVYQNATPRRVEVTMPNGTKSVQLSYNAANQYNDGLAYQDETYDSTGKLLSKSTATWEPGAYESARPARTTVTNEPGQVTATEYDYGVAYNLVTEVRAYDYGGTALLNKTLTQYETSTNYTNRHIFNLVKQVEVYAANGTTRESRTEYTYDGQTLSNTPGVVQHDDAYNPYAPEYLVYGGCSPGDCPMNQFTCDPVCEPDYYTTDYDPATDYRGNVTSVKTYADAALLTGPVTETRRYDIDGNMVTASTSCCEQTSLGYTSATQYAYPTTNTRGSATDATKQVTTSATYSFNTGLVLSSTDANGRTTQNLYFATSLRTQKVTLPSGAYKTYAYDDAAMTVTEITYLMGGTVIASSNVKRLDGLGQVSKEEALTREGGVDKWDTVETQYDNLGRLKKATGGTPLLWTQSYGYGRYGNRTSVTATGTADNGSAIFRDGFALLSYSATSNQITTTGFAHDAAGNQVRVQNGSGAWQRYQYDAAGRLVKVKTDAGAVILSYTYGASNERLMTEEGALRTYYARSGSSVTAEYTEANASGVLQWDKNYVYLGGRLLATQQKSGTTESIQYHHPDRLGTRLITNASDTTVQEQSNLPYGVALDAESTGTSSRRFTSYERNTTTGLDYAVNRHYDSMQGRFTQVDPVGMEAASLNDPQSLNLYAYCGNDPVNRTDPNGLFWGRLLRGIGRIFSVIDRILRYIVVAAIVAVAVLLFVAPAVIPPLLSILGKAAGFAFAEGGGIKLGAVIAGVGIGVLRTAGAVGNHLQSRRQAEGREHPPFVRGVYIQHQAKIARCIWKIFGADANKLEHQTIRNAPDVDLSQSGFELGQELDPGGDTIAGGLSRDGDEDLGPYGTVHIANDIWSQRDLATGEMIDASELRHRSYVHELGNLLNKKVMKKGGVSHRSTPESGGILTTNQKIRGEEPDFDTGARLEQCVFGNNRP